MLTFHLSIVKTVAVIYSSGIENCMIVMKLTWNRAEKTITATFWCEGAENLIEPQTVCTWICREFGTCAERVDSENSRRNVYTNLFRGSFTSAKTMSIITELD